MWGEGGGEREGVKANKRNTKTNLPYLCQLFEQTAASVIALKK